MISKDSIWNKVSAPVVLLVLTLSLPLTAFGANLAFERNLLERFLGAF